MSRSYRKPYSTFTGSGSAKGDKILAARGVRRAQNQSLYSTSDWEEFLIPHKLECSHNETYSWSRDGGKHFYGHKEWKYGHTEWFKSLFRK